MAGQCADCSADPWDVDDCFDCINAKTAPCNICEVIKDLPRRYIKTADPTVDDDTDLGYKKGDIWINTNNSKAFICIDESDGAADWDQIN
jgi:hypothetical protein